MDNANERFDRFTCYTGDCIVWTGWCNEGGYGGFKVDKKNTFAHRFAYARRYGSIPPAHHIDHLCHNKICVNPAHLNACTPRENVHRAIAYLGKVWSFRPQKTHCPSGHPYMGSNLRMYEGRRYCRACMATWNEKVRVARKAKYSKRLVLPQVT